MATIFQDSFTGSSGTNLESHAPEVGNTWLADGGLQTPELDGSGFVVHDPASGYNITVWAYADGIVTADVTDVEITFKIVGDPAGWSLAELITGLCANARFGGLSLGFYIYTPASGTGTIYVDYLYGNLYSSFVYHTQTISGLSASDSVTLKIALDSVAEEVRCYHSGSLVQTIDASSITPGTLDNVTVELKRSWDTSPRSNVFALDSLLVTDGVSEPEPPPVVIPPAAVVTTYAGQLVNGDSSTVDVPISSWQSTLNTADSSYAQINVPTASSYAAQIVAAVSFRVLATSRAADGTALATSTLFTVPIQNVAYNRGPFNDTATITGYVAGYTVVEHPAAPEGGRQLAGIQTRAAFSGGTRYRSAVDISLAPQQRIYTIDGDSKIERISSFVSASQAYMDVTVSPYLGTFSMAGRLSARGQQASSGTHGTATTGMASALGSSSAAPV